MTAPDSNISPPGKDEAEQPPSRGGRLGTAGDLVNRRLGGARGLQRRYLDNESQGRADLAALRKAVSAAPGEHPEIWSLTEVRDTKVVGDDPTWEEIAVHTAMTLYAVHQQSRTDPMFKPGHGLGRAARQLIGSAEDENPSARARFNALVTSTTVSELRHHLRGFVSQLRARSIPLDHAMLADDLVHFQRPGGAKNVRLRWSRQYAWLLTSSDTVSASTDPTPSNPEN